MEFKGDGQLATNPIVVNNTVYEGSGSGNLYAVSVSTGTEEWSTNFGTAQPENIVEGDDYLAVLTSNGLTVFAPARCGVSFRGRAVNVVPKASYEA